MSIKLIVKKNFYFDSFSLMKISTEIKKVANIREAMVCMATELNKDLMVHAGLMTLKAEDATPNDLVIAIEGKDEEAISKGIERANQLLEEKGKRRGPAGHYQPRSLDTAIKMLSDANLTLLSIAGKYVKREAIKALQKGLNVMIFSDNVPIEDEIEIKRIGKDQGLLVMGPDCGTAIINGIPLAFANEIRRGVIGIIGASGTGMQEICVIVHKAGAGISQAIGVGGRDLSKEVGGITTRMAIKSLGEDKQTKVIVFIAKAFERSITADIMRLLKGTGKPVIVHLIGSTLDVIEREGLEIGKTLQDTAIKAVMAAQGFANIAFLQMEDELKKVIELETRCLSPKQKYLRGLFCGGSFCAETLEIFFQTAGTIHSNLYGDHIRPLANSYSSIENTALDLGDDAFTLGRAHPMIDPTIRINRLLQEANDPETAVVLMDVILGYGSSPDIAGSLIPTIKKIKMKADNTGAYLSVVVNLCGTEHDPQNYFEQERILKESGVVVFPTNELAARAAAGIIKHQRKVAKD